MPGRCARPGVPGQVCGASHTALRPALPPRKISTGTNSSRPSSLETVSHSAAEELGSSHAAWETALCLHTRVSVEARAHVLRVVPGPSQQPLRNQQEPWFQVRKGSKGGWAGGCVCVSSERLLAAPGPWSEVLRALPGPGQAAGAPQTWLNHSCWGARPTPQPPSPSHGEARGEELWFNTRGTFCRSAFVSCSPLIPRIPELSLRHTNE